jgi:hypothetical protein
MKILRPGNVRTLGDTRKSSNALVIGEFFPYILGLARALGARYRPQEDRGARDTDPAACDFDLTSRSLK